MITNPNSPWRRFQSKTCKRCGRPFPNLSPGALHCGSVRNKSGCSYNIALERWRHYGKRENMTTRQREQDNARHRRYNARKRAQIHTPDNPAKI